MDVDDVVETANHFRCIDMVIDSAKTQISERFIKQLHAVLKSGTSDSRKAWFAVGDYKKLPNEVGGQGTAEPEQVAAEMQKAVGSIIKAPAKLWPKFWISMCALNASTPFRTAMAAWGAADV